MLSHVLPCPPRSPAEEIQEHMQQLRTQTLRSLSINSGSDMGLAPHRQHLLQHPPQQSPLARGQYNGGVGGTTGSGYSWTGPGGTAAGARGLPGGGELPGPSGDIGGNGAMAGVGVNGAWGSGKGGTWGGAQGGYDYGREDPLGAASHSLEEALSYAHPTSHLLPSGTTAAEGKGTGMGVGGGGGAGADAVVSGAALGPQTSAFLASILSDPNVGAELKEAAARLYQQRQQQGAAQQLWQQQQHAAVLQLPVSRPASTTDAGQGGMRAPPAPPVGVQGIKSE